MFDDFRKQLDEASFPDDQQEGSLDESFLPKRYFLGMTPVQRFAVSLLLLLMVIILGVLFLLVTSKIVPPFIG